MRRDLRMHTNQHTQTHTVKFKNCVNNMTGRLQGTRQTERVRKTGKKELSWPFSHRFGLLWSFGNLSTCRTRSFQPHPLLRNQMCEHTMLTLFFGDARVKLKRLVQRDLSA